MNTILIKPLISEKSMLDASNGKFTFVVNKDVNKALIISEIVKVFNVKPVSIKTINIKGKTRRSNKTRQIVRQSGYKKAIIELEKGQKIDLFDVAEGGKKNA